MSNKELLFETKYGKMTGYEIFVKYCETRDWDLMNEVIHVCLKKDEEVWREMIKFKEPVYRA